MSDTNLTLIRGDFTRYVLTVTRSGSPYDITGSTVFFTMKDNVDRPDSEAAAKKTITSHFNPSGGISHIDLDAADTYNLRIQHYYYDVQIKLTDGKIYTVVKGRITVQADVTRRTS